MRLSFPAAWVALLGLLAVVASGHSAWADVAPSPTKGFRFIWRRLVVDRTAVPDDIPLKYDAFPEGRHGYPFKVTDYLRPDVVKIEVYTVNTDVGTDPEWGPSLDLDIPPQLEATHDADPRDSLERRYRLSLVKDKVPKLQAEVLEDVLYDSAGKVLCRRPPLDEEAIDYDPCDPTTAARKRARYTGIAAMVFAPLLVVAGLFFVWRRRRRRGPRGSARGRHKS